MDNKLQNKMTRLVNETRVMTLAVSMPDMPWSSPVYFVFHDGKFYFFSNENSKHIQYSTARNRISASIFNDGDRMEDIYGCQMTGMIEQISKMTLYLMIVKKYVAKFNFLENVFGKQILENKRFFLEKFKSHLYCFSPETVFLSDNSRASDKRIRIDMENFI